MKMAGGSLVGKLKGPMPLDQRLDISPARDFPATQLALGRHLPVSEQLVSVQCFVQFGLEWQEAARIGRIRDYSIEPILKTFDASAGGMIEPLSGGQGWLGHYMTEALDRPVCLIMQFSPVPAEQLTAQLERIESKVGWIALAVLRDCQDESFARAEDSEFVGKLLLDSAKASSRIQLAQQWIARIERLTVADIVAVVWKDASGLRLAAVSGSGRSEKQSEAKSHLEAIARFACSANEPRIWEIDHLRSASSGPEVLAIQLGLDALHLNSLMAFSVRAGERQTLIGVVCVGYHGNLPTAARGSAPWIFDALHQSVQVQELAHPSPFRRVLRWTSHGAARLLGTSLWRLKLALLLLLGVGLWASLSPMTAEPGFTSRIEAQQKQVMSAPFDGFIQTAPYRLGDRIDPGARLLVFDTADIQLEMARHEAELAEIQLQLQSARGRREAAQVQRLSARESQIKVAMQILGQQIESSIKTIDKPAIVLGGDAWQRIGDRVRLGEPLLEIASADDLRVLAFVDEDWITSVTVGSKARIQLSALPEDIFFGQVESIGTDTRAIDGVTAFPVWISLPETMQSRVMDGMRGVTRMQLGQTTVLKYYTRGIRRWIDRQVWRWTPS